MITEDSLNLSPSDILLLITTFTLSALTFYIIVYERNGGRIKFHSTRRFVVGALLAFGMFLVIMPHSLSQGLGIEILGAYITVGVLEVINSTLFRADEIEPVTSLKLEIADLKILITDLKQQIEEKNAPAPTIPPPSENVTE